MVVYYLDDNDIVNSNDLRDVANLAQCEQDLDECYDGVWSWDKQDMVELVYELNMYEAKATMCVEDFNQHCIEMEVVQDLKLRLKTLVGSIKSVEADGDRGYASYLRGKRDAYLHVLKSLKDG